MKRYKKELTAEELAALPDSEIDYSDIPELDETFWEQAIPIMPGEKARNSLRVPDDGQSRQRGYRD